MNNPKVSIIILNWNRLADILECLESVKKSDYLNYNIVVVDNASTDNSVNIIKNKFPDVVILTCEKNLGFAGGNNVGMKYAVKNGAEYVWLLNNDTTIMPDTLVKIITTAEKSCSLGLVSPIIYYYSNPAEIEHCGANFDLKNYLFVNYVTLNKLNNIEKKNPGLFGTALLIKQEVITSVGYLNEGYFAYYEDVDYSWRALKAGYSNEVAVSAKVYHKAHKNNSHAIKNVPRHFFYYTTRNEFWFWISNSVGFKKVLFVNKYLARIIRKVGTCKEKGICIIADAYLDGLYCAFLRIDGEYSKRLTMPKFVKKLILWHPYFLADLVELNFANICSIFANRKLSRNKSTLE